MKGLQNYFSKIKNISNRRTIIDSQENEENFSKKEFIIEETVTFILSKNNWVNLVKGTVEKNHSIKYKEGDKKKFIITTKNTGKIIIAANNGKVYNLDLYKLSLAKSFGEHIGVFIDLPSEYDIVFTSSYFANKKVFLISKKGKGFIAPSMMDLLTHTKVGKSILDLSIGDELKIMRIIEDDHDHLALLGTNRKLLVIKLNDLPIQKRGKGVILQKVKNGFISDSISFNLSQGIVCNTNKTKRSFKELKAWVGKRSQVGKIVPKGFPRSNMFNS